METLISLLIIVAIVAVALWLIRQIPWPAGLEVLNTLLTLLVVVLALVRVYALLA